MKDSIAVGMIAATAGLLLGSALWRGDDPEPRQPLAAEVDAAIVMDSTTIEMHGYGPDGKIGEFLYDCKHADEPALGDPTLICTQRKEP